MVRAAALLLLCSMQASSRLSTSVPPPSGLSTKAPVCVSERRWIEVDGSVTKSVRVQPIYLLQTEAVAWAASVRAVQNMPRDLCGGGKPSCGG
eukprot:NODE_9641_length_334_cov_0.831541.p3 GENE.NODE_9641_length_334_cov_0.831541~~NODE_9641_length_334_cov_0.831541.p3  ORF type:complete len:93 (+),score=6.92 NODE_9641_length_334_cov_0.831541:54-332(+)